MIINGTTITDTSKYNRLALYRKFWYPKNEYSKELAINGIQLVASKKKRHSITGAAADTLGSIHVDKAGSAGRALCHDIISSCVSSYTPHVLGWQFTFKAPGDRMKPSFLKRHLETRHADKAKKDIAKFQRHEQSTKRPAWTSQAILLRNTRQRYVHGENFKHEFLFNHLLQQRTRGEDVFDVVSRFLQHGGISWANACAYTTDGAPAMMGCRSRFRAKLAYEFQQYFPDLNDTDLKLAENPFKLTVADIDSDMQEELTDLVNDSGAHDRFEDSVLSKFWCSLITSYPKLSEVALKVLLIFPSSYKCEQGFSSLLYKKSKYHSRLNVDDDLRVSLSVTELNIKQITDAKKPQPSH
ncbi:zinc finger MYM-type protein 6-like [Watersipora subatra]|uniref:zinc finger MYM-type protein 6-like n=1 Tax=Watersipora subatra TaxID=2589382 RepID=UPI00355B6EB0